ncbi:MAG TPA: serine protease [Dyella sp.]|uniref:S1 family peptidase n=1 Tax=Dyella sp. TaxID=1869338 RepID=UPI002F935178
MRQASKWLARRIAPWMGLVALALVTGTQAATLDPAILPKVQAATFEVVIPKPVNDSLSYEKPLPLDQLPFQFRNDKYFSIGTAFAIGNHRYATAAHVFDAGMGSLMGEPALRDANGKVFAVDKIVKFSREKDFVVFTLKDAPDTQALETNTAPAMNDVVYAVGNALGTGVVIRDGLYTSNTPEEQDGRWKWMRFSAAASPGNSGGPLLDKDGKIIGIVLMKSPGENLNYALPIDFILKAPDNLAEIDTRMTYQLDVLDSSKTSTFKTQFALPKTFKEFTEVYQTQFNATIDGQLADLLKDNKDNLFPVGNGSNELLHSSSNTDPFPTLIVRSNNGVWSFAQRNIHKETLSNNGFITSGVAGHEALIHLRKPDNIGVKQLYADPKLMMDLMLKALPLERTVGSEKIKITSLGKPSEDTVFTDSYQRKWQVRVWPVAYDDSMLVTFSLPVPDGYVTMMRTTRPAHLHDHMIDLRTITNFFDVSYSGTLAQWKEFLQQKTLLPAVLDRIDIDFAYAHSFKYQSKRVSFDYTPDLQKIDQDSQLILGFSYFKDGDKVVWDVSDVLIKANVDNDELVRVNRHIAPSEDLDTSYQNYWKKVLRRDHPDDGAAYNEDDMTYISMVGGAPDKTGAEAKPSVLYTASYGAEGSRPQDAMKTKLDLLMRNLQVNEH